MPTRLCAYSAASWSIRAWSAGGEPGDAQRIAGQSTPLKSRDVYCYFDNDIKVRAPFDARSLIDKLGLSEGLVPFSWHARP